MKIVRPYGMSKTVFADNTLTRVIQRRGSEENETSFVNFAKSNPGIVLAQWISAIDKIAAKPNFQDRATKRQHGFRQKLGEAVWKYIAENEVLAQGYEARFWEKIHPYPHNNNDLSDNKTAQIRGRWFRVFFGDVPFWEADLSVIGQKLYDHLYTTANKVEPEAKSRNSGLIQLRGEALENSTPYGKSRSVEHPQTNNNG